jgi:hypothetical protein
VRLGAEILIKRHLGILIKHNVVCELV